MIVKILSSAASFLGVNYNEAKVEKGTAELLACRNFGMLEPGPGVGDADFRAFFHTWSRSGEGEQSVRQPQFHAVISCEGREKDGYELQDIAEQYLEKMGYGDNPYLIYFHTDTANNHVHIVSSRVNRAGKKIDDSFERTRSQKAIKEILKQDMGEEIRGLVARAMGYNFSTEAQFKMLLERQGIKLEDDGFAYCLIKYGRIVSTVEKDRVAEKAASYTPPEARANQLRAMFAKHRPGRTQQEFRDLLQTKFGVELVYHQARGKDTPYGYSIIDHAKKQVLKGSQVMKLKDLLYPPERISPEQLKAQRHEERAQKAREFAITGEADIRILQRLFQLQPGTLETNAAADANAKQRTADRLSSMLANGKALPDILEANGWHIASTGGEHYLIDRRDKALYPVRELTERPLDYAAADVLPLDREPKETSRQQLETSGGGFAEMLALLAQAVEEAAREPKRERKIRRKLKR